MSRSFLMSAALAALASAAPSLALPTDFKAKADALLAASYSADGPGASVVVSEHGKIVYVGARGMADVAAKRPITPDTVFRIGSITKQFSAAVVLQLAAEGKLKLSDPLSKYLPTFPNGSAITVEELLNHSSGIQSYTGIPGWMTEANTARAYTTVQLVAVFKGLPAPDKPGAKWEYNNSGYILVGALIEAVTGKPWYQAVDERIARPLGLKTIRYGGDEAMIAAMAKGYSQDDSGVVPAKKIHMSVPAAAGALVGTPADLAKWGYALHHGKVVPAPFYEQMIAPSAISKANGRSYGFGLETEAVRGAQTIGHGGGIFGFSTGSVYFPAEDVFVAVYANSDQPQTAVDATTRRLAAMAIGKPYPTFTKHALDATALAPLLGVYKFKAMNRIITIEDGKLLYQRPEGATSELIPVGGDLYSFGLDTLGWVELKRDAADKPVMRVFPDGEDNDGPAAWTGPVPPPAMAFDVPTATLKRYIGSYTSPMGPVKVAEAGAGKLIIQLAGQPAIPLRATGVADFDVERVGAKVHFVEENGKVVRLEIAQRGRTLPATRD
ncbi:MAG: beta-lactamase family protein [Sphingomonas bacterium]|nr:beta-lactamase family protein [Sphingomonas bacterium]